MSPILQGLLALALLSMSGVCRLDSLESKPLSVSDSIFVREFEDWNHQLYFVEYSNLSIKAAQCMFSKGLIILVTRSLNSNL